MADSQIYKGKIINGVLYYLPSSQIISGPSGILYCDSIPDGDVLYLFRSDKEYTSRMDLQFAVGNKGVCIFIIPSFIKLK